MGYYKNNFKIKNHIQNDPHLSKKPEIGYLYLKDISPYLKFHILNQTKPITTMMLYSLFLKNSLIK